MALSTWLIVGIYVDAAAHLAAKPETFFSPWHALLYSGWLATALWLLRSALVGRAAGRRLAAVPVGYGLGLAGAGLFLAGGLADMAWHTVFGIEVGVEPLLSPPHLLLFVASMLMVTSPLRAAWASPGGLRQRPSLRELLPALGSVWLLASAVLLILPTPVLRRSPATEHAMTTAAASSVELKLSNGILGIVACNLVLVGVMLLLTRRWVTPRGTFSLLFGAIGLLQVGLLRFRTAEMLVPLLAAGIAADLLASRVQPASSRTGLGVLAAAVPAVQWTVYFAVTALTGGLAWSPPLFAGTVVLTAVSAVALTMLLDAPAAAAVPLRDRDPQSR